MNRAARGKQAKRAQPGHLGSSASSLHAKTFAVDAQRIFVGSFNFDPRSIAFGPRHRQPRAGQLAGASHAHQHRACQVLLNPGGTLYWIARDAHGAATRYDTEPGSSVWKRMGMALLSLLPIDWLL
ncbi:MULTISPECIES: hypothetical protein [unclassified Janthinobacterium]|uniref:hypothetical protein n=1 Tax=unclassified Janthinobacterium TaxID=2610881 RepID=UPI0018CBD53D|nr:hypothetical protein [Janthinobacterium sp. CG_23.4]MDH6157309.1 hypothetical protein [Janthinobacterium sp. CG_23.4]